MKGVQRFRVKRKLTPRYVGPYPIIGRSGNVAYKLQLPPEMSTIFNVFHVSQLRKCLRVPEETIEPTNLKLQSYLTYEEKPVQLLDEKERVTRSKVIKFYKVMWNNHSEWDATWEREDYLREVYPKFMKNGRHCKSQGEISVRGKVCNSLGVKLAYCTYFCMSMSIIQSFLGTSIWNCIHLYMLLYLMLNLHICVCQMFMCVNRKCCCLIT